MTQSRVGPVNSEMLSQERTEIVDDAGCSEPVTPGSESVEVFEARAGEDGERTIRFSEPTCTEILHYRRDGEG